MYQRHTITITDLLDDICTGLFEASLSLAWSRHSLTFLLGLGTNTKLLPHSDVSSTHISIMICCFCGLSNSPLNGFGNVCVMHPGSACYALAPSFTCNEKVPFKHLMIL